MKQTKIVFAIVLSFILFALPAFASQKSIELKLGNDLQNSLKKKAGELTVRLIESGHLNFKANLESNTRLLKDEQNEKIRELYLWDPRERPKEFGIGQSSSFQVGGGLADAVNDNGTMNAAYEENGPSLNSGKVKSPMPALDFLQEHMNRSRVGGGLSDPVNDVAGMNEPYVDEEVSANGRMPQSPLPERNDVQNKEQASAEIGGGHDNPVDDNDSIDNPKPAQDSNDFAPKFDRPNPGQPNVTYNPGQMNKNPSLEPGMFAHPDKTHEALMKPGSVGRWDLD